MKRPRETPLPLHRDPDAFLYTLVAGITGLALRLLFRLHISRAPAVRQLRGPAVVIGNHPSYLDPFIMGLVMLPRRINFLTTANFFRSPLLRRLLFAVGAIPKVQFRSDIHAMKQMIATIRAGGMLGIFPEGQRSVDGRTMPYDEAIAKMIQRFDCPVVTVLEHGAYLAWPRWSLSGPRPGRIDVSVDLLFPAGEAGKMTVQQIRSQIGQALAYDEYEWQRRKRHAYLSTAPASGLHLILHRCPACGRSQAMAAGRHRLTCRHCSHEGQVDRFGLIQSKAGWPDAAQWHRWQIDEQAREMADPDFRLPFRVRLERPAESGQLEIIGSGLLTVTRSGLSFQADPDQDGRSAPALPLPFGNRAGVNADYGLNCELVYNDEVYRFVFADSQDVIRLVDVIQAAHEKAGGGTVQAT